MNKDTKSQNKDRLSTKQVAERLGISTATVGRLVDRGLLTQFKKPFGKVRVTYDPNEVERLYQEIQL